jgi:ABC-type dipeptide/oligopeptide/nickel transport system permease subunit
MAVSLTIGLTIGLLAGYFGGVVDTVFMWIVDLFLTLPSLLLLIVLATVLPPSILTIPLVIGITGWTTFARTVRGEVLTLRERDYVQAARALGAANGRIMLRHLLPGVLPGVIVLAALGMSGAIIVDAGLSYLGLGVPLPTPSWGRMVSDAQTYVAVAPWLVVAPGVSIALAVIGFNLIGYGLVDLLGRRQG